jgi:small conductance mechanosensitive channel
MTLRAQDVGAIADTALAPIRNFSWDAFTDRVLLPAVPKVIAIAATVAIGFLFYRFAKVLIGRLLTREIEAEDPLVRRLREQRAQTLASLLGNVAIIVITVITLLTALGQVMDIGPLLASVGVLGLAVSFGAQSLVKDVITGTFLLVEGQFGIGDIVRLGDASGVVEKITLRTTVLRDLHGVVHIVPNGEITRVSNLTKSWSRAVLDIGVAYKEDVDRVMDVLRDVGRELQADAEWSSLLLEEPVVMGIEDLADSAVVIRMNAKTLPMKQFDVARELRRRIKNRFDRDGIEIPFPHLTFYWGDAQAPKALSAGDGAEVPSRAR